MQNILYTIIGEHQSEAFKNTPNLVLKRMLEIFLNIPPPMKILKFQD